MVLLLRNGAYPWKKTKRYVKITPEYVPAAFAEDRVRQVDEDRIVDEFARWHAIYETWLASRSGMGKKHAQASPDPEPKANARGENAVSK